MKRQLRKIMLLALFSLLIAFFALRFDLFTIKKVNFRLENINCADEKQIKDSLNLSGENFFFLNTEKLEDNLKSRFICINNISLSKYMPDKVSLTISGRDPYAILVSLKLKEATKSFQLQIENMATPSAGNYNFGEKFLVDKEGVVFSGNIDNLALPNILFLDREFSFGDKIGEEIPRNTILIINKLKGFGIEAGNVAISNNKLLVVYSTPKIIFNLSDFVDVQLASLQLILEKAKIESKDLEFIDLRFDKPIVKFAPKKK